MKVILKRYRDGKYIESAYQIEVNDNWTVLDVLSYIKENIDETLAYRVMCRSSICGTCAVRVNEKHILACKEKIISFGECVVIEPISNLSPIKDLVVEHNYMESNLKKGKVWFKEESYRGEICKERFSRTERQWDCIACLICEAVCPVFSDKFGGPYTFTRIYRILEDPRYNNAHDYGTVVKELNISLCVHCSYCSIFCPKGCMPEFAITFLEKKFNIEKKGDNLDFLSF